MQQHPHSTPIQIRFNDADPMGHINNAVIIEYLDLAKENYLAAHGLEPDEGDFTVMVVHCDIDFRSQIHRHDSIEVHTMLDRIGNRSITLHQEVIRTTDNTLCCDSHTVMSGYRRSTSTSAPIPDSLKEALLNS